MLIGHRLQQLRKKRKLTQKVLAERAGISRSYLADIEHNRYNPSLGTIEALTSALKLDMKSFFDDTILADSYYLKPLNEETEEVEELSDNEIEELSENNIVEKEISRPLNTSCLSEKELRDIKDDLDIALSHLDDLEKDLMFDEDVMDLETRQILKTSLEHSMQVAKAIAKSKFNPKRK
ncbi:helix-turn-helix domain-containing protein [Clostridium sp. B9]|uniref:helix-turn-helix domain-containing protein n=1 Tax=Clostridium sp. B9 TaxID=3423224 RepID=UPI003D2F1FCF